MRLKARLTCSAVLAVALLPAGAGLVFAQAVNGSIVGNVADGTGAALPGATLSVTETRTGVTRSATSNASGHYVALNLQDGVYRVEAALAGFKTAARGGVVVRVNTTVRVDFTLQLGEVSETIDVVGGAPALQTDRADTGRLIEGRQVAELPLGFGRNFQGLLVTVPGATRPFRPHSEFFNPQDSLSSQVNGQSRLSNNVQIEGIDNNYRIGVLNMLIPSADAIEGVSVSTSNFNAELGRAAGAVTSVTLKSGTNDVRGSLFFFGNDERLMARDYFTGNRAETDYRQYGLTLGGPLRRNKLFFFVDYQRTRDDLGRVNRHNIPPMEWRTGDLSGAPTRIYDPATGNADGTGRQVFPGNRIPADRISPIARNLLALLPEPNVPGAALGQTNYIVNTTRRRDTHGVNVKLNLQASERDALALRLSFQRPELEDPGSFGVYGGPANGGFAGSGHQNTYGTALNYTRTMNASLLFEARAGFSYYRNEALTQGHGLRTSEEVGIRGANLDDFTSALTTLTIGGFSNPLLGFSSSIPWDRAERVAVAAASLTKVSGNHTVKVGLELNHNRGFTLQLQGNGGTRGEFGFGGAQTSVPSDAAATAGFANAFAAFLLDAPNRVARDLQVVDHPGNQHLAAFTFVHDKWQVSPRLTVDLGLRHELYQPLRPYSGRGGLSNYDIATNTLRVAGYGATPLDLGLKTRWTNFAPRLGLALRVDPKTVARAGFGTSIVPLPGGSYADNFPVKQNNVFNPPNTFARAGSMAVGFPAPVYFDTPADGVIDAGTPALRNAAMFHVPSSLPEGRVHSWNVALQRELTGGFTAEAAYVGNVGVGLMSEGVDLNAGRVLGADNAGRPFFASYGRTASIRTYQATPDTSYHSLQAKLDRRFANGFQITTSYTLGRAINYSDDSGSLSTPADVSRSRGRAGFDRKHSFVQTYLWELPFGRGRTGALKALLGGWQVSGIFVWQSGTPINFTANAATLRAPGNTQTPNLNGTPAILGSRGPGQKYFDVSVFSAAAPNTWGNMTRNSSIDGPSYVNLDASVVKRFELSGRTRAEVRVDAFNATNTPKWGNPNASFGSQTFGEINSATGQRVVRVGARLTF